MKGIPVISAVGLGLFVLMNAISYVVLSDGNGVRIGADGIQRAGFPWQFWERGGFSYRHNFSVAAMAADLLVALIACALVAALYRKLKR